MREGGVGTLKGGFPCAPPSLDETLSLIKDSSNKGHSFSTFLGHVPERIITACHLTFAGPKGPMSDQNLVWCDILANEIIRTRLNVWQFIIGLTFCQITSEKL